MRVRPPAPAVGGLLLAACLVLLHLPAGSLQTHFPMSAWEQQSFFGRSDGYTWDREFVDQVDTYYFDEPPHLPNPLPGGLETAAEGRGRCLMLTSNCIRHVHLSKVHVDEREDAYVGEGVGEDESRCLERARLNWEFCGSVPWEPLEMLYAPTGASHMYPPAEEAAEAEREATSHLVGRGDGLSVSGFWGAGRREGAAQGRGGKDVPDPSAGGEGRGTGTWKVVFAYVEGHELRDGWVGGREGFPRLPTDKFNGEFLVDKWVVDVFRGRRGGFFLDLAAHDAVRISNTVTLERLGWDGLCVESGTEHLEGLMHRRCIVVNAVVGAETGEEVSYSSQGHCGSPCARMVPPGAGAVSRRTVSLGKILADFEAPRDVDFLSLDLEGAELDAIGTFPFDTHRIMAAAVEVNDGGDVVRFLEDHGMRAVRRVQTDVLLVHQDFPDFADVMERHYDAASLAIPMRTVA